MPSLSGSPAKPPGRDGLRRWLIAVGTACYDSLDQEDWLPSVHEDLDQVARLFCGELGYQRALEEVSLNPTRAELHASISDWLTSPARSTEDVVIFYYSGHGLTDSESGRHYLLTRDYRERNPVGTAFATEELMWMMGKAPMQHLLVLLDTCYAGRGALDMGRVAAQVADLRAPTTTTAGWWFLAAARPKDEAAQGAFATALTEAVRRPRAGALQPHVSLEELVEQINTVFCQRGLAQQARLGTLESGGVPPFIPNPDHIPYAPTGLDLASLAQLRQAREQDVVEHWDPRARGVALASDPGWYFSGRTRVLRELVAWLRDPDADHKARVVTGDPGSGKSAVLARLVILADPKIRATAALQRAAPGTVPPEDAINVAVHARNRTLGDLVALLAAGLGVIASTPEELAAALTAQPSRRVVAIDALDEAVAPEDVAGKLLRPLLDAAPGAGLRLLLGTRRPLLDLLGTKIRPLDLDDPAYLELADLADYVTQVLLATHEPDMPTPYRDRRLAEQVAWAVARRANPTFLIARIVAQDLRTADKPLDPTIPGWEIRLPASVGHAFDAYLERFGLDEQRARDLLTPLAFAQGAGLPWEQLWAPLASALAEGKRYGDEDIRWLQQAAGAYLVEARDHDRSGYRLYHQALAEHLRALHPGGEDAQQRLTQTLVDLVPLDAAGHRDWAASHPYITGNLASHAAAAGLLDDLLLDPGFLVVADIDRLLPVLPTKAAPKALTAADVYRATVHRLRGRPVGEAAAYFQLTARQLGHNDLANKVAGLPLSQPWSVPWAKWASSNPPSRIVGAHDKDVTALALTVVEGHPVVVTGSSDSTVRIWDLIRGVPLGPPLTGHTGAVQALAVGEVNGCPVAVSGGDDHTVLVWDLARRAQLQPPLTGHTGPIEAVGMTEVNGRPMAVTVSTDTAVRVWDLTEMDATGPALGERRSSFQPWRGRRHSGPVSAIAVGRLDDQPIAVSGSEDGTVHIWDLEHGSSAGKLPSNENVNVFSRIRRKVTAVALGEMDGRLVAIIARTLEPKKSVPHYVNACLQVWDLNRRELISWSDPRDLVAQMVAVGKLDGRLIALVADRGREVTVWDLSRQAPVGLLTGHTAPVRSMAVGELDDHPIAVTGSADRTVRVWDLTRITPVTRGASSEEERNDELGEVRAVAAGEAEGKPIVVTGGSQSARIWDARDGAEIAELRGHFAVVEAVAVSELLRDTYSDYPEEDLSMLGWPTDAKPIAVTGSADGTVRIWDLHGAQLDSWDPHHYPPNPLGFPRVGGMVWITDSVLSIAVGKLDDRALVVIGSSDPYVRAWLIQYSWFPTVLRLTGHTNAVTAVAVGEVEGRLVAVTGSLDMTVRVWNLDEGKPIGAPLTGHTGGIHAVAIGTLEGLPIAVTGGRDSTVRVWDLSRREPLGPPLTGHTGSVQAVAVGRLNGETLVISGGTDGTLRVWHIRNATSNIISLDSPVSALALGRSGRLVVGTVQGVLVLELSHAEALPSTVPLAPDDPQLDGI